MSSNIDSIRIGQMFYHSILKTVLFSWSGGLGWSTSE